MKQPIAASWGLQIYMGCGSTCYDPSSLALTKYENMLDTLALDAKRRKDEKESCRWFTKWKIY